MAKLSKLAEILVCPKCRGSVTLLKDKSALVCRQCRLKYPITQEIPVMLIDEALPYDEEEITRSC